MIDSEYNLIDENWISVVGKGKVGLKQIFSDFSLERLGGNPIEKISLFKLLLAIGQSAFTPENEQEWKSVSVEEFSKKCLKYLDDHYNQFYLYGEKPFLQMPEVEKARKQPYGAVIPQVATGNTTVVTEIQQDKILDNSEKALLTVLLMSFALGGKKTDNSVILSAGYTGKFNDKGKPSTGKPSTGKPSTGKPAPAILSGGILHSFIFTESLVHSIFVNLFSLEKLKGLWFADGVGIAPWEVMPKGEDDEVACKLKSTYMGRLVPMSRFILLEKNELHYTEGILHNDYSNGIVDLSATVNFSAKPKTKVLWVNPEKRPWRELTALLSFLGKEGGQFQCLQIENVKNRLTEDEEFQLWSAGLKVSSNAGEQYVSGADDFVESYVTMFGSYFGTDFFSNLMNEMKHLDDFAKKLYGCVMQYYSKLTLEGKPIAAEATSIYWQLCENEFQKLIDACGVEDGGDSVRNMRPKFKHIVYQVYDQICPNQTARQLEAWAECKPIIKIDEE